MKVTSKSVCHPFGGVNRIFPGRSDSDPIAVTLQAVPGAEADGLPACLQDRARVLRVDLPAADRVAGDVPAAFTGTVEQVVFDLRPATLTYYAQICGWTLARAHARSGDPVAMAAYLGRDDAFERSITDFSERYADQNEKDYEEFAGAVRSGRLKAVEGV